MTTTIVSSFAVSEKSGHLLVDDLRVFQFFLEHEPDFKFYATPYSCSKILSGFPSSHKHLMNLHSTRINITPSSTVIWMGFAEVQLLFFILLNLFKRPRIVLIATNNFSYGRLQAKGRYLSLLFLLINPFILRLVVHTNHEKLLVSKYIPFLKRKLFIKKHHLMTPHSCYHDQSPRERYLKSAISFFGPIKTDKPIEPFIHLIKADKERRFTYYLFNVKKSEVIQWLASKSLPSNIHVEETWRSFEDHATSLIKSTFVFMSHDSNYEGKLSGNLCDCISFGIPYISRPMEPVTSLENQYGAMGYTADFSDPDWSEHFIDTLDWSLYHQYYSCLERAASAHSYDAITSDLKLALLS